MPPDQEVKSELDLGEPSKELLDWAEENIGENQETRCQLLSDLRDMIYAKGECDPHRTDDAYLLRYLRARHFKVESAYKLLANYYAFKENNPQLFEGVNLNHLKKFGEEDFLIVPPYREQTGRRIVLYRIRNWDPEKFTPDAILQVAMLVLELAILEQRTQILGGIILIDLGGLSMQQACHLTPSYAHKVVQILVTTFPMRVHALHVVNQSWLCDIAFNIFKPFLVDKMRERVFFHGDDMESLHRHIDPNHLPEAYGGVHPEYDYNQWIHHFRTTETIRNELLSLGYREPEDCDNNEK